MEVLAATGMMGVLIFLVIVARMDAATARISNGRCWRASVCIILCWDDGAKFRFAGDCGGVCGNGRSAPGICVFCSAAPVGACGRQRVSAVPDTVSARGFWWRGCEADGADRFFAGLETELVCICCELCFLRGCHVLWKLLRKEVDRSSQIPFGPFLCLGTAGVLVFPYLYSIWNRVL